MYGSGVFGSGMFGSGVFGSGMFGSGMFGCSQKDYQVTLIFIQFYEVRSFLFYHTPHDESQLIYPRDRRCRLD